MNFFAAYFVYGVPILTWLPIMIYDRPDTLTTSNLIAVFLPVLNWLAVLGALISAENRAIFVPVLAFWSIAPVPIWLIIHLFRQDQQRPSREIGGSYSHSGDSADIGTASDGGSTKWPWSGKQVVIGDKSVYQKGWFSNTKVGRVDENIFTSGKTVYKEGFFSSEKVGKVETNFWGTPKTVADKDGNKVGDIKTTWTGRQIIVDEDGNEIGEYKGD